MPFKAPSSEWAPVREGRIDTRPETTFMRTRPPVIALVTLVARLFDVLSSVPVGDAAPIGSGCAMLIECSWTAVALSCSPASSHTRRRISFRLAIRVDSSAAYTGELDDRRLFAKNLRVMTGISRFRARRSSMVVISSSALPTGTCRGSIRRAWNCVVSSAYSKDLTPRARISTQMTPSAAARCSTGSESSSGTRAAATPRKARFSPTLRIAATSAGGRSASHSCVICATARNSSTTPISVAWLRSALGAAGTSTIVSDSKRRIGPFSTSVCTGGSKPVATMT
mmetsp:Transcript_12609/g.39226  ORF Transcript_12609/g.39226 Transcript_12609/m.39226 type:complete len:283 (+) Transcript_12609:253-1101(+)